MARNEREVDVFNRYSGNNKAKIIIICVTIAVVMIAVFYFFAKSLFDYTVTFELNGGSVFGEQIEPRKYRFLQKVEEPENVRKEGYYLAKWSTKSDLSDTFQFGTAIWNDTTLYADWQPGYAIRLHFAEGEENKYGLEEGKYLSEYTLKLYYEEYFKPGTTASLPVVYNEIEGLHKGEQLLWYENSACTGSPISIKNYVLTDNVDVYGRWFDTSKDKFLVDSSGTLQDYLGYCNRIILPSNVLAIKDIDSDKFIDYSDQINNINNPNMGTFKNVHQTLETIYLNAELKHIGDCAFKYLRSLKEVYCLGNNVETLGEAMFQFCDKLEVFHIPSKVTVIPKDCFRSTVKLKSYTIPSHITRIEEGAFMNSNIEEIRLTNVEFIGRLAFAGCTKLKKVELLSDSVIETNVTSPTIGEGCDNVFFSTADHGMLPIHRLHIYVPDDLFEEYKASAVWGEYFKNIPKDPDNPSSHTCTGWLYKVSDLNNSN